MLVDIHLLSPRPCSKNLVYAAASLIKSSLWSMTNARHMCSTSVKPESLFRHVSFQPSPVFSWKQCIAELQSKCPTLYQLLREIVSQSDQRNRFKRGDQHFPGMCVAIAILLKERNRHMTGIQTLLSMILYYSRVQKKVCS